jgi:hypothetical protein
MGAISISARSNSAGAFFCVTLATLLAGCASTPRPTAELTRAHTLIDQAQQSGAQQYAPADLTAARDKTGAAENAANKGDTVVAQRLATEAALDAQLAAARADDAKAQQSARELNDSLNTLRNESAHKTGAAAPPAGTAGPPPAPTDGTAPNHPE